MTSNQIFTATIRGIPENPSIKEINIRSGPATVNPLVLKAGVGVSGLPILDVMPDAQGNAFQGKVYQWFKLQFPNSVIGWARDDLISISGDGRAFGYDNLPTPVFAFTLTRNAAPVPAPPAPPATPVTPVIPAAPVPAPPPPAAPAAPVTLDLNRVKIAAFNITAGFEGGGYSTYQNYDAGIVSYGRFQFTLVTDGIFRLIDRFSTRSNNPIALELRNSYMERARKNDATLRHDQRFKQLLIEAGKDPIMQAAQDELATEKYWNVVLDLSIRPRGYQTALAHALIFDMGINFGTRHGFITKAEEESGFSARTNVSGNLPAEQKIITRLAEIRKQSHDRQAERDNLPGLRVRGDFWVNLCKQGDWNLQGDSNGMVTVKPGVIVKVRNF
jgi:Glycosyl hydrolase family 46